MEFAYNSSQPSKYEGWLSKASIGLFERWQRRYFRLQGRCIYYFKKDTGAEPPCGNIPLIDIEVTSLPPKKSTKFPFSIALSKDPSIARHAEYFINADTEEIRKKWIDIIKSNMALSIVGQPFELSTRVSPDSLDVHNIIPYFLSPIIQAYSGNSIKTRNIWTVDVPNEIVNKGLATLNMNYMLSTDNIHETLAILVEYFTQLPDSLIPGDDFETFAQSVDKDDLMDVVRSTPAPVRQLLFELGMHLNSVTQNTALNGVTTAALETVIGPMIIRPSKSCSLSSEQIRNIQKNVAHCFIQNAPKILEDVHQFRDAPRRNVIKRARIIKTMPKTSDELLEGHRGLLVNIVNEDEYGWCTVYTSNRKVGLVHKSNLKILTTDEEADIANGGDFDSLLDVVREKCPDIMVVFDGMTDELFLLQKLINDLN